jgi:hypothetical protein
MLDFAVLYSLSRTLLTQMLEFACRSELLDRQTGEEVATLLVDDDSSFRPAAGRRLLKLEEYRDQQTTG